MAIVATPARRVAPTVIRRETADSAGPWALDLVALLSSVREMVALVVTEHSWVDSQT